MGMSVRQVCLGRSQCVTLRVRGSDVTATHSYILIGDVHPLIEAASLTSPFLVIWLLLPPVAWLRGLSLWGWVATGASSAVGSGSSWCSAPVLAPSCTLAAATGGVYLGPAHTPSVHLFCQVQYLSVSGPQKHPEREVCRGHFFGWLTCLSLRASFGSPLPLLLLHGGCVVEQELPIRRAPIPGDVWCSSLGDLFLAHQGITDPRGPGRSPFLSVQFAEHHILLFCLKL